MTTDFVTSVRVSISRTRIAEVLCGALDSGVGQSWKWAQLIDTIEPPEVAADIREEWGEYRLISWPLSEGGALILADADECPDPAVTYQLDLAAVRAGIDAMAQHEPKHLADLLAGEDDAITSDVLLQCALFGKVVW